MLTECLVWFGAGLYSGACAFFIVSTLVRIWRLYR
jgi:hypothetical protein